MALIVQVNINSSRLYLMEAVRLEGDDCPEGTNLYRVRIYKEGAKEAPVSESTINHRYGDGALELSRKMHEVAIAYEKFYALKEGS